jgi:photosystem II stability/assembly factor-like uncharacterized protein
MRHFILFFFCITSAFAQQIKVENILTEVPASFRAISAVDDQIVWVSGSKGHVGRSTDGGKTWKMNQVKNFESLDFRSCYAFDSKKAIIANAGEPANILKTTDGGETWKVVYQNENKEAFFDGIDFWNEKEGIVFGDPINSKMLLLKTEDGGETWKEVTTSPALQSKEASFAASGTTIRCIKRSTIVIATGGSTARLWISNDKAKTWTVAETKMAQGTQGSGIFSIAFNKNKTVMVGGDFENDKSQPNQSFYSIDNGKTWTSSQTFVRGWRECVEFIAGSTWITTGPSGMEISNDDGKNWTPFSEEKNFHVIRRARKGKLLVAAGSKRISLVHP